MLRSQNKSLPCAIPAAEDSLSCGNQIQPTNSWRRGWRGSSPGHLGIPRGRDPKALRAAVTAQLAVAIAILAFAPVRLANLTAIRLGTNLIKPDGPDSNYWLVFPDYDVKNRVRLDYPLEQYLTQLIDEYVHDFRPTLVRGSNEPWLFPGQRGGAKG